MEEQIKKFLKQLRLNESLISTVLGVVVVLIAGFLLYRYFSSRPSVQSEPDLQLSDLKEPTPVTEEGKTPESLPSTHKVMKGEDLWKISEKYYGSGYNWVDIARENEIKRPNQIEVDMELKLPVVAAKKQTIQTPTPTEVKAVVTPEVTKETVTQKTEVRTSESMSISGDTYTVVKGDSLWTISVRAYADGYQWPKVYQENKGKIGRNPGLIEVGMELKLPR